MKTPNLTSVYLPRVHCTRSMYFWIFSARALLKASGPVSIGIVTSTMVMSLLSCITRSGRSEPGESGILASS